MYLPIGIIIGKSVALLPKWVVEEVSGSGGGLPVGEGYGVNVVVGCCVGLHWNIGDACKSWSPYMQQLVLAQVSVKGGPECG